jgi:hypothetical protein
MLIMIIFLLVFIELNQQSFGEGNSSMLSGIPDNSRQMILVLSHDWNNFHAEMYLCEREAGKWNITASFPAVVDFNKSI